MRYFRSFIIARSPACYNDAIRKRRTRRELGVTAARSSIRGHRPIRYLSASATTGRRRRAGAGIFSSTNNILQFFRPSQAQGPHAVARSPRADRQRRRQLFPVHPCFLRTRPGPGRRRVDECGVNHLIPGDDGAPRHRQRNFVRARRRPRSAARAGVGPRPAPPGDRSLNTSASPRRRTRTRPGKSTAVPESSSNNAKTACTWSKDGAAQVRAVYRTAWRTMRRRSDRGWRRHRSHGQHNRIVGGLWPDARRPPQTLKSPIRQKVQ